MPTDGYDAITRWISVPNPVSAHAGAVPSGTPVAAVGSNPRKAMPYMTRPFDYI